MIDSLVKFIALIEEMKYAGRYAEAKTRVQECLLRHANDYRLYEELADIALYENNLDEAEAAMKIAFELNPESATGTYLMGYILISRGQFQKGVKFLEQSNKLFPNNPEILRNLGWGYTVLGQVQKGIILLERALNLAPEDELIMEDLGVALISDGQEVRGEEFLRRAGKEDRIDAIKTIMHI